MKTTYCRTSKLSKLFFLEFDFLRVHEKSVTNLWKHEVGREIGKSGILFFNAVLHLVCYTAVFSVVTQHSSALLDDTKNGCVADYVAPSMILPCTCVYVILKLARVLPQNLQHCCITKYGDLDLFWTGLNSDPSFIRKLMDSFTGG